MHRRRRNGISSDWMNNKTAIDWRDDEAMKFSAHGAFAHRIWFAGSLSLSSSSSSSSSSIQTTKRRRSSQFWVDRTAMTTNEMDETCTLIKICRSNSFAIHKFKNHFVPMHLYRLRLYFFSRPTSDVHALGTFDLNSANAIVASWHFNPTMQQKAIKRKRVDKFFAGYLKMIFDFGKKKK